MISNPGRILDTSGYMQKSIYDSTNKNKDIFSYVDSQVATRTTSSQVASQISTAVSSFVTSSQVDAKIQASENDPFKEHSLWIVPYSETLWDAYNSYNYTSTYTTSTQKRIDHFYLVKLPVPIQLTTYNYNFIVETWGLGAASTSVPYLEFCKVLPQSNADTYQGDDFRGLKVSKYSANVDFPNYAITRWVETGSLHAWTTWAINYKQSSTDTGTGLRSIAMSAQNGLDLATYTHIGFDIGTIRTQLSTNTTTDSRTHVQTYGIRFTYSAFTKR